MKQLSRTIFAATALVLAGTASAQNASLPYDSALQQQFVASLTGSDQALALEITKFVNTMFDWYETPEGPAATSWNKAAQDTIALRNTARRDYEFLLCVTRQLVPDPGGRVGWAPAREDRFYEWLTQMADFYRGPRSLIRGCEPIA